MMRAVGRLVGSRRLCPKYGRANGMCVIGSLGLIDILMFIRW